MAAADVIASATAFRDNVNWSSKKSKKNTTKSETLVALLHDAFGLDFLKDEYNYESNTTYAKPGVFKDKKPTNAEKMNYPGDDGQAGGVDARDPEDLPDADDDPEKTEELLRQGREARLQIPERAVTQHPQGIAHIVEKFGMELRSAWKQYDRDYFAKLTDKANNGIQDFITASSEPVPDFKLAGHELCGHILRVRQTAWVWKNARVGLKRDDKLAPKAGETVCLELLGLLKQLASSGINWKTILPDSTHKVLVTIVEGSALDASIEERLVGYINEDYTLPSNCQARIADTAMARGALTDFFQAADESDTAKSKVALSRLRSVNTSITSTNVSIGYKEHDHILPIKFLETMFEKLPTEAKDRESFIAAQKAIHYALFHLLGFTTLANLIVVPKKLPKINLTEEHQQYVSKLCLDWGSFQSEGSTESGSSSGHAFTDTPQSSASGSSEERASNGATSGAPRGSHDGPDAAADPGQESAPRTAPSDAPSQGATEFSNSQYQHANQSTTNDSTFQHGFRGGKRPGPCFDNGITFLGKVVAAQKAGFGYRVIVNCALDSFPVYKCYPGKQFGRGTAAEMAATHPMPAKQNLKARKAAHISHFLGIFEVEGNGKVRQPITMMRVCWKPSNDEEFKDAPKEEWLTRSDVISICGDEFAERTRQSMLADRAHNLEHLRECKERGVHPETGEPMKESERELTPWLFPDNDTAHKQQSKKSSAKEDDDNDTSHIRVGGQRFGANN